MNLLVIGASRGVGAHLTGLALNQGHRVTALSRQGVALSNSQSTSAPESHPLLTRSAGNFHDAAAIERVMPGHDAVVITAGLPTMGAYKHQPDFFSRGTRVVIDAMHRHGVPRLVILSAFGVGDSWPLMNLPGKLFVRMLLSLPYADHDRQEVMAREAGKAWGLEWVIARPTRLTDGPAHDHFVREASLKNVPSSISRASVATFLLEAATTPQWLRQNVQLGG